MWKIKTFDKRGQNTAEYAIVIALVVAVAIAMQTYVKRGMQGRVHDASDKFYDGIEGDVNWTTINPTTVTTLSSKQYEPTELSSKSTQDTIEDYEKTDMSTGGKVDRESTLRTKEAAEDYKKYEY